MRGRRGQVRAQLLGEMGVRRIRAMLAVVGLVASMAASMAQAASPPGAARHVEPVEERFCLQAVDAGLPGDGVAVLVWRTPSSGPGKAFVSFDSRLKPGGEVLSFSPEFLTLAADGSATARFVDNWGAPARARVRRSGDKVEIDLARRGEALAPSPAKAVNYGRFTLSKAVCRAADLDELPWAVAADAYDLWRYTPGRNGRGAVAEFIAGPGSIPFRATCERATLRLEFFTDEGDPRTWDKDLRDLLLILRDPATEHEQNLVLKGEPKARSIVGRLALTPALARAVATAPMISLYGENGPSNEYPGGRSEGFRRLVRECAPKA